MIQKLRRQFTAAAMLSLLIVLALLMGAINLYNYRSIVREADETLSMLSQNRGRFPDWMEKGFPDREDAEEEEGEASWYRQEIRPPREEKDPRFTDVSAELPFASRYFSVERNTEGETLGLDLEHIAAIDKHTAVSMAAQVMENGKTAGFSGRYRYVVVEEDGFFRITFLDCSRDLANARVFLWASVIVSLIGLAAVFGLMLLLSGRFTRPMAESYAKQKRFITDAGHEIKTPITIIDADTELLSMDLPDSEWLADIRLQTRRLADLTNDLIFLSRMDEEQKLQRIDFSLSDMVGETAASFRSRALREEKTYETSVEPMISFCGDEKALRQLVSILIDNALKYSPAKGRIDVRLEKTAKTVVLSVSNSCDAVPEGDLDDLFDRFYRGERSRNSATGGHGLGLAIARAVVTAHKGRITASAPDGHTMRFEAVLPF